MVLRHLDETLVEAAEAVLVGGQDLGHVVPFEPFWESRKSASADRTLRDALASEARAQSVNFATADAPAALAAFREKGEPVFTGEWAVG
ncbi:hypothetical protein QIS99_17490 [Streptomyces sp. B-S-A8]|uniref:Uncharacterized protein n=1 Tax=Streptomyces solicavernae TaxID=3043614 RepID=A0ABT6RU65_9ACTN|nr:hypothetical protein [Streptomyces sp. B-S-A8]MDI3387979.1 hypothetical protein [Streptomyces sp. B-S-A8]